jgi:hypothetical protein
MEKERSFSIKVGFELVVVPGRPPQVQVVKEKSGCLVFQGVLLSYGRRKIARKWLSQNYVFLDPTLTFAKNSHEAAEIVEKKLVELWGNPFAVDFPDWVVGIEPT